MGLFFKLLKELMFVRYEMKKDYERFKLQCRIEYLKMKKHLS